MNHPASTWKILLVDDDEDDYRLTRTILSEVREQKIELVWAQSYEAGLRRVCLEGAAYDAVLVDYDLGRESGIRWIREVAAQGCPWPLILYTSRGSRAVDLEGMEAGASLYLTKFEATPLLLERAIRYAIERKQSERDLADANRRLADANRLLADANAELEDRVAARTAEVARTAQALEERNQALEQANRSLAERESLLNQVFETLYLGTALLDCDFNFLRVNRVYARLTDHEPDFFIGKNFFTLFPNSENETTFRRVVETGQPFFTQGRQYVYPNHPERGVTYWNWSLQPVPGDSGKVICLVLTMLDVTEQWRAKKELEETTRAMMEANERLRIMLKASSDQELAGAPVGEEDLSFSGVQARWENEELHLLRGVIEHLPIGVWIMDDQGAILYGNPAGQQVWAGAEYVRPDQFTRYRAWWYPSGKELQPEEWAGVRAARHGETSLHETLEIECFDGSHKIIRNSAVPFKDPQGRVRGVVVINEDISAVIKVQEQIEEQRVELQLQHERLRASEERWRAIFDLSAVGQASADPETAVLLSVNRKFCEIIGYSQDELVGMSLVDLTYPEDREEDREHLTRMLRGQNGELFRRKRFVRKDGSICWVEVHGALIRDAQGQPDHTTAVILDINQQVETEELIDHYFDQLARSNRELEQFAFVASHDLQEPVRKIESFAALLKERARSLNESEREYLDRMQGAAARMRQMIEDLLALSRVTTQAKPYSHVDLVTLVNEVVDDLDATLHETGGRVEVGELPDLEADPVQMRLLLQNLLSNALKFHREGVPPVARVSGVKEPGSWVRIEVADNGVGFKAEFTERIFQPFTRLNERWRYKGTGMGLAICRKIVERHGGEISAEGRPGEGAVFWVRLPKRR